MCAHEENGAIKRCHVCSRGGYSRCACLLSAVAIPTMSLLALLAEKLARRPTRQRIREMLSLTLAR